MALILFADLNFDDGVAGFDNLRIKWFCFDVDGTLSVASGIVELNRLSSFLFNGVFDFYKINKIINYFDNGNKLLQTAYTLYSLIILFSCGVIVIFLALAVNRSVDNV